MRLHWVPANLTYRSLLRWVGISEFAALIDEQSLPIQVDTLVEAWRQVIIQSHPDTVALDLDLLEVGFGHLASGHEVGSLQTSDSWISTGLWHLDQLIKTHVLMTWIGGNFKAMTIWLPSFAAAVVEGWPHTMDEKLGRWFGQSTTVICAIVFEEWGWNIAKFEVTPSSFRVIFFEKAGFSSVVAAHVAFRAFHASRRAQYHEAWKSQVDLDDDLGSLKRVMHILDHELGLPTCITQVLHTGPPDFESSRSISQDVISPTLQIDEEMPESSSQEETLSYVAVKGLSAGFMNHLVNNKMAQDSTQEIQVVVMPTSLEQAPALDLRCPTFQSSPLYVLLLINRHWILAKCTKDEDCLKLQVYDGVGITSACHIRTFGSFVQKAWNLPKISISQHWILPQKFSHTCGTVALGHLLLLTGVISYEQAMRFENIHDGLTLCDPFQHDPMSVGFGPEDPITEALEQILPSKGVPVEEVKNRAQAALRIFGKPPIQKALNASNVWAALKQLGNSRPKPFMWVTHAELQEHIKERATTKYGADVDIKRPKKSKEAQAPPASQQIDPANLVLPSGIFVTNCGTPLSQLPLSGVIKNARGVAFATAADAQQYLSSGTFISPEGLALLIVGHLPDVLPQSLPMHSLRVPAIYKATNEPILLDCTSIQLGDQAVYQKTNQSAPEVQAYPSVVFRAHVFRDLWETDHAWQDLVDHPIRNLVATFDLLRLCKDRDCTGCHLFHPSLEEEGIESGLLDVWGFKWAQLDGSKIAPPKASVLSVYIRVPESSFDALHVASGQSGVFFEPRQKDQPAPDNRYAVIWVPQGIFSEMVHRVKTHDECLAVCRMGSKYGIRCLAKNHEALHATLVPNRPYVKCNVKVLFRLEPLPAGTQRQSLVATLQSFGWTAKPLHPCAGSQGKAWLVGTEVDPPAPFIEAQHGWISISKVRDQVMQTKPKDLIATAKTKQHIKGASVAPVSSTADPWRQAGLDPWSGYQGMSKTAVASNPGPTQHVQSKFDEVEQKLQDHVTSTVATHLQQADAASSSRLQNVENQIQTLVEHQTKMQQWIQDGASKIQDVRQDYAHLYQTLNTCTAQNQEHAAAIASVVQDIGTCNSNLVQQGQALQAVAQDLTGLKDRLDTTLEAYFDRQAEKIESLLSKRQRHD